MPKEKVKEAMDVSPMRFRIGWENARLNRWRWSGHAGPDVPITTQSYSYTTTHVEKEDGEIENHDTTAKHSVECQKQNVFSHDAAFLSAGF